MSTNESKKSFSERAGQSPVQSDRDSLSPWDVLRNEGIAPLNLSALDATEKLRTEFEVGALHLGIGWNRKRTFVPQQLVVADALNVGNRDNAILLPRRSSKSTTVLAWALGRVAAGIRVDYRVAVITGTSGKAGRARFKRDVVPYLDRMHSEVRSRFKVYRGNGDERVEWTQTNNSIMWASSIDDVRGEAFDVVIVDEAGEPEKDKADDIRAAALPTLDTRPGGMLVYAGTAGDYREGNALWNALEAGRKGIGTIVEYAMPADTTVDDIATWELAEPLIRASHPGIDTLTTIDAVRSNYEQLGLERFLREYGSIFGDTGGSRSLVSPNQWAPLILAGEYPEPPKHFALAIAVHPSQSCASIVAVWREGGAARIMLLDHRDGTSWLAAKVHELWMRYRVPIVSDSFGPVVVVTGELNRMTPRPRLEPQLTKNVTTAAALLVRDIHTGNLGHWDQPHLNAAILGMVRRQVGANAWALGRPNSDADITAAEAVSLALHWYDEHPQRARIGIIAA